MGQSQMEGVIGEDQLPFQKVTCILQQPKIEYDNINVCSLVLFTIYCTWNSQSSDSLYPDLKIRRITQKQ